MISDNQIRYGSRVDRQGRSRFQIQYHLSRLADNSLKERLSPDFEEVLLIL
jgi:hypothetical protein